MRYLFLLFFSYLLVFNSQAKITAIPGFDIIEVTTDTMALCDIQNIQVSIRNISPEVIDSFTIQLNCDQLPALDSFFNTPVAVGDTFTAIIPVIVSRSSLTCPLNTRVIAICDNIGISSTNNTNLSFTRKAADFGILGSTGLARTITDDQLVTYSVILLNQGNDSARNIRANIDFSNSNTTFVPGSVRYNGLIVAPNMGPGDTLQVEWIGNVSECPTVFNDWNFQLVYQPSCIDNSITINTSGSILGRVASVGNYRIPQIDSVVLTETSNVGEICISISSLINIDQNDPRLVFSSVLPNWLLWNRSVTPQIRLSDGTNLDADSIVYNSSTGRFLFITDYPTLSSLSGARICIGGLVPDCEDSTDHAIEEFFIEGIDVLPDNTTPTCAYPIFLDNQNTSRNFLNRLNAASFDFSICATPPSTQFSYRAFRLNIGEVPTGCTPDSSLLILNDTFRTIASMQINTDGNREAYSVIFFRDDSVFADGNFIETSNFLIPTKFRLTINDNSTGRQYTCTNINFDNIEFGGTNIRSGLEYPLHIDSLIGNGCDLPAGFTFDQGDTVELIVDYLIVQNISQSLSHIQTIYATNNSLPFFNNTTTLSGPTIIRFDLQQTPTITAGNSLYLCDNRYLGARFSLIWNNGSLPANPFDCERRNIFTYDQIQIDRLASDPFNIDILTVELDGDSVAFSIDQTINATLDLESLFENNIFDETDIIGNDLVLTGTFPYNCNASFTSPIEWGYAYTNTATLNLENFSQDISELRSSLTQTLNSNFPENLDMNSENLSFTSDQFIWDVRIINPLTNTYNDAATQFWLNIDKDDRLVIDSIVDMSSPNSCGVGRILTDITSYYPITLGDCGTNGKLYRIYGSSNACFTSTINAELRFRCNALQNVMTDTISRNNENPLEPCIIDNVSRLRKVWAKIH